MRRILLSLLLVLLLWSQLKHDAFGQESIGGIFYSRYRQFRIPFQANLAQQGIRQLQLFVSTDNGRSWQQSVVTPPDQGHFGFMSGRDGLYWFAVQTQDVQGRLNPISMDGAQPSLKVVVDTQPPFIALQPLAPRGGEVGVAWDIRDENLDLSLPDALRLEYRLAGGTVWQTLPRNPAATQHFWRPEVNTPLDVRLRARDRAGNWGDATTSVSLGGSGGAFNQKPPENDSQSLTNNQDPERRFVGSKRVSLTYEVTELGPSGISQLELWFTQDGRSWNKYPSKLTEDPQKSVSFELAGEGIYGLSLVAKSGVGLGERPPQIGDRPQVWVEVDLSKPVVQLYNVIVGQGMDKGKLTITWAARDKNLQPLPITISYTRAANEPWTPVVPNLPNTGRYVWNMPDGLPYQFHVRVEAIDLAGNIGEATTEQMVKVDLSQPKAKILTVEPSGR